MNNNMTVQERCSIITQNLQEVVDQASLLEVLSKKDPVIYWGTAPTGMPHLGYFVPMYKIADFLRAGCHVKILFADMHGYLDNMKSSWELLHFRTMYYEFIIKEILNQVGVPLDKLTFVKGSEFQLSQKYTLDMYKLSALTTTKDTQKAGAEVVKQVENPKMSGLLYPILQALDEEYLQADIQFGGVDQRKIFMFAREFLPKIGYQKRIHLMNTLIPGLSESGKMSSSEPNSKIDFTDSAQQITKKIAKAYCVDGQIEQNGLLACMKHIIFLKLESQKKSFVIDRPEKYGGTISFNAYAELEHAFAQKTVSSIDLKQALTRELIELIAPLREKIHANKHLVLQAYPDCVFE
jgi:tyrosyl-tRNA synthetase